MQRRLLCLAIACAFGASANVTFAADDAASPGPAPAQDASATTPAHDNEVTELESIQVTARRRSENIEKVPVAVSAFSEEDLKDLQATNLDGLQGAVPGLNIVQGRGSSSSANVFIRGIGQPDALQTFDPGVGLYVDDVYYSRIQGALMSLFDVDHVEVLRGPQGTLYGKNSTGGAIKVVTRDPSDATTGSAELTVGNYGRAEGRFYLAGGFNDAWSASIAGAVTGNDGYVKDVVTGNRYNDDDTKALRASLHALIDGQAKIPYTASTTDTWDVLAFADEDPANPSDILDIYKNASYPKAAGGNDDYNREHTWPDSLGFPDDGPTNFPYTDLHMLMAADIAYNADRGNLPYGNCTASCTEYPTVANDGRGGGSGTFPGNSNWSDGHVWQAWRGMKGNVARAILYMDVRYEGGTNPNTGTAEPDLRLTDNASLVAPTGGNASVAYMGLLSVLLQWNQEDPVDDAERLRNDAIQSYQGNRNPFVDHPEWATCIYQGACP